MNLCGRANIISENGFTFDTGIVSCMYVIEELERIGDYAEGIAVLTIKMGVRPLPSIICNY